MSPDQRGVQMIRFLLLCVSVFFPALSAFAGIHEANRDSSSVSRRPAQLEFQENGFIPSDRRGMEVSPAFSFSTSGFFAVQVNVDSAGRNIVGDAANEPSIAIDPANPDRMAVGWRQFNTIASNFRQAGFGFTTDGGRSWKFPGVIQSGVFRSDPVLDSDGEGNIFYNSLTTVGSGYRCDVFKSTNGGASWNTGTFAHGGDKQWMVIDKSESAGNGNHYAFWTSSYSACPPGFFTRSKNRGFSYESCSIIPGDPFWGTLATGPVGELYVCGYGDTSFVVAKSTSARDSSRVVGWDSLTAVSLDGDIVAFAGSGSPNPGGLLGQAWVAADVSGGPYRGYVYVLCSVGRTSNPDPLDVMFTRSTNGGRTWSAPVRVNDDPNTTAWQWFGTMSVAPSGRIDVVWLDTRDNPASVNSSLYYSYSTNAGATWAPNVRLSQAFDPHAGWPQQNKMGDYFHMISRNDGAHLAWAATFGGEQNVYYGHISYPLTGLQTGGSALPAQFTLRQNYPNPFNPTTTIEFALPRPAYVTLDVYDILGQKIRTLVSGNRDGGNNAVQCDASELPSGVYLYRIEADGCVDAKRMILLK